MSVEDVKLLGEKIDALAGRVGKLELAVTTLMVNAAQNDKTLKWLRMVGLLLLGAALGSGVVKLDDVIGLAGTP
jgi:uncharacterized protein YigA (DUF484 family)